MPPARAIAIAVAPSVTESIAALTSGTLSAMLREKRDRTSTSFGSTSLYAGASSTSSNVRHSRSGSSSMLRCSAAQPR